MPRTARITPGGMVFHVLNRGVGRMRLFNKDRVDGLRVTLTSGVHDYSPLARLLLENGHALTQLTEDEINLETAFMTLTKGITS